MRDSFRIPSADIMSHSLRKLFIFAVLVELLVPVIGYAEDRSTQEIQYAGNGITSNRPPSPLGLFVADMPPPGMLVLAVAPRFFHSGGELIGSKNVSPVFIVANTPWYFDRRYVVRSLSEYSSSTSQTGTIHYGITDRLSIASSATIIESHFEVSTFQGSSGVTPLGKSFTGTAGFSDFTTTIVYKFYDDPVNRLQINIGAAYPLGLNTANNISLRSDGLFVTSRASYGGQPGSHTFDFLPGILYGGNIGPYSWGLAYRGRLPVVNNPEGWRYGNGHELDGWVGYQPIPEVTATLRVAAATQGRIRGFDPEMNGKSPGANPTFYGGQRAEIFGGIILEGKIIGFNAIALAIEAGVPFYQNLNGPQQKENWQAGFHLRYAM